MHHSIRQLDFSWLDTWTPELAWWLGALYGDGCVFVGKGDYRVVICGSISTVTRWLAVMRSEKTPQEFKRSPGTYQAGEGSKLFVERMRDQFGIYGPKSASLVWPKDLPTDLVVHFLRGLWDTDGSLSIAKKRKGAEYARPEFKVSYTSQTKSFVERVRAELEQRVEGIPRVVVKYNKNAKEQEWYAVGYGCVNAVRVGRWLYEASPEHLRNEDRFLVWQSMKEIEGSFEGVRCGCGALATKQGKCEVCFWDAHGRSTGEGTVCGCGKAPILAQGLCTACYNRLRRSKPTYERKSTGACVCGRVAYRKGMCDACYARERRLRLV